MGVPMAARLADAGYDLTVWNRTARPRAGRAAATPAEAVAGRDVVITMLADPPAVLRVLGEAAGALKPGAVVVEMSTIGPDAVTSLRSLLPGGVALVDAPVLGSVPAAAGGTLTIVAGGAPADVAAVDGPLSVLGTVVHAGPLGAGAALKLVVNAATITSYAMLGDVLALAGRLGVAREAALDALAGTPAGALVARVRPKLDDPDAPVHFRLGLAAKDLALAEAAGADGLVALAARRLAEATRAGLADRDLSAVVTFDRT